MNTHSKGLTFLVKSKDYSKICSVLIRWNMRLNTLTGRWLLCAPTSGCSFVRDGSVLYCEVKY